MEKEKNIKSFEKQIVLTPSSIIKSITTLWAIAGIITLIFGPILVGGLWNHWMSNW